MAGYDEEPEDCLVIYDEDDPLGSAKRLVRYLEYAAGQMESDTKEHLEAVRNHLRHCKGDKKKLRSFNEIRRKILQTRREAKKVRRRLSFARNALQCGETQTLILELKRLARFSTCDESSLEFRTFGLNESIEPSEYQELLQRLSEIDAGTKALH